MLGKRMIFGVLVAFMGALGGFTAQEDPMQEILRLVNAARTAEGAPPLGAPPLVMNTQLTVAAQRHSSDMAATETLSHVGSDGSQFWQRIADAGYNMNTGAQNVLSRSDLNPSEAFTQWRDSPTHYANIVNPVYQEIGLAYAVSASGTVYYTMLLAARNDFAIASTTPQATATPTRTVPPPTVTPTATLTTVPPSATPVLPTATATNVITVTPSNTPIVSVTPSPTLIPPSPTPQPDYDLRLTYDNRTFTLVNIGENPVYIEGLRFNSGVGGFGIDRWNTGFLSASLAEFPSGDCLQAWGLETFDVPNTPPNCNQRHGWVAVNDTQAFWRNADTFTVYRLGDPVTVCTVSQGECYINLNDRLEVFTTNPTLASAAAAPNPTQESQSSNPTWTSDIRLSYSADSFTILNTSGSIVNLNGLSFGSVPINWWNTEFLSRPLSDFPPGDCLQAWSITLEAWPGKPAECDIRHAWIGLTPEEIFWQQAFTVSLNGAAITTCTAAQGICDFNLP